MNDVEALLRGGMVSFPHLPDQLEWRYTFWSDDDTFLLLVLLLMKGL